jgi:hypothetical protein
LVTECWQAAAERFRASGAVELVAQGNVLGTYTSSPIELFSLFMEKDRYVEIAVRFRLHSGQLLGGQASLCFQILEANGTLMEVTLKLANRYFCTRFPAVLASV